MQAQLASGSGGTKRGPRPKARRVFTNLVMTPELKEALDDLERLGRLGEGEWKRSENVGMLLACLSVLRSAFATAPRKY